ncbi:MAG TPA: glycosyltransferase family 39 protein [Thermomicrobiales bacterium]
MVVTLLAAVLRLPRLGYLGLSVDEGYTLTFTRQSWRGVLGLDGFYDYHPPLFFALAKLATLAVPEVLAARVVAVLAGVATVPLFYALCLRLLDRRAAFAATVLLSVSPLHIFASRWGRMYTVLVLAVLASYLCLIALSQSPRPAWAVGYGVALAVALYVDYSAAYALAPQAVLLVPLLRRGGRPARYLAAAIGAAVLAYLPWVPQLRDTVAASRHYGGGGRDFLVVNQDNARMAALYLLGFNNYGSQVHDAHASAWDRWPDARPWLQLALVPIVVAGVLALRRAPRALTVTGLLIAGTIVVTVGASQLSPGFAARTMLVVVPGWALLVSAALAGPAVTRFGSPWPRRIGAVGWCFMVAVSLATLPTVYFNGSRNEFPRLAADLASQVDLGKPILVPSADGFVTDVLDVYAHDDLARARVITLLDGQLERETGGDRWLDRGPAMADVSNGRLADLLPPQDPASDAVWLVRRFNYPAVEESLKSLGYQPVTIVYYYLMQLVLYARPGASLGAPVGSGGGAVAIGPDGGGWQLPPAGAHVAPDPEGNGGILVFDQSPTKASASRHVEPAVPGLYTLTVEFRGGSAATLACQSATGTTLRTLSAESDATTQSAAWSSMRVAVLCPAETSRVAITLTSKGQPGASFRRPGLTLSPSAGTPPGSATRAKR